MPSRWMLAALLLPAAATARPRPAMLTHTPSPELAAERPMPTAIRVSPQGANYALEVTFTRAPWGEECKNRCANATLYLDTDLDRRTGLQLGKDAAETGADLAITFQGIREYKEVSASFRLRVKVRGLSGDSDNSDRGTALSELDHRRDADRLQTDGNTVFALVEATDSSLPTGKKMRIVYHPPGEPALSVEVPGILTGGGHFPSKSKPRARTRSGK